MRDLWPRFRHGSLHATQPDTLTIRAVTAATPHFIQTSAVLHHDSR